jgi:tRNA modification GTPase
VRAALHGLAGGGREDGAEGGFSARARHVDALRRAGSSARTARVHLGHGALELAAEALRDAHDALGELTGRMLPDDLLGHIFARFCIGK